MCDDRGGGRRGCPYVLIVESIIKRGEERRGEEKSYIDLEYLKLAIAERVIAAQLIFKESILPSTYA